MESLADKARACAYALIVHVLWVALFFGGLLWTQRTRPLSLAGPVIEAELVGLAAAPKPRPARPKPARPKPAAEEAPKPPPAPPPSEPQREDRVEREKVAELARAQAEAAERAQEERRRQEQALLEKEQRELKQLEEIRRQREAAERRLKLEKEKLAQLNDLKKAKPVTTPPQPVAEAETAVSGTNGREDSLQAQYFAAIQNAVTQNWLRPESTQPGLRCMLHIVQIPGGDVIGVQVGNPCNADPLTRNSIEQAVKRASPLPYKGYEKAFTRDLNFNFTYDG